MSAIFATDKTAIRAAYVSTNKSALISTKQCTHEATNWTTLCSTFAAAIRSAYITAF